MSITYRVVETIFSVPEWQRAISQLVTVLGSEHDVAEYLGVSDDIVHSWVLGRVNRGFPYPMMTNFLKVVNALDLWPRDMSRFFEIESNE